jgi:hypothetical protein
MLIVKQEVSRLDGLAVVKKFLEKGDQAGQSV